MTILLTVASLAYGWEAYSWIGTTGHSATLHFCASEMPPDFVSEIERGFNGWNAGPGTRMPGPLWSWTRGADHSPGTCSLNLVFGTDSEVWDERSGWFAANGHAGAYAVTYRTALGARKVVFNEDYLWHYGEPSDFSDLDGALNPSVADVAMHEMGHVIGFDHEFSVGQMSIMHYGHFDMARGKMRIREDDYVGLAAKKTSSTSPSSGVNLMLSRYMMFGDDPYSKAWFPYTDPVEYEVCVEPNDTNSTVVFQRPGWLSAVIHGTYTVSNVLIEWRAATTKNCFQATPNYLVGSRTPTLGVNDEYVITTGTGELDFTGVPPGWYYVCAKIDPNDVVSETNESDNSIVSEVPIEVVGVNDQCDPW